MSSGAAERRRIRIGVAGMGAAGQGFVPAVVQHAGFEWVALAEPVAEQREPLARAHGVAAYEGLTSMLAHPGLEAVIVATPTPLHAEQACQAARAGCHVIVEKPMAVTLDQGRAMISAAQGSGVVLLVGHSHSHDAPIWRMHELIRSGVLGPVRMAHTWCYSDWMHRPRRADELDAATGGGVTLRQGSHQFDILRLLCGGRARSVRARTFDWNSQRPGIGAHSVFIDFEEGAAATAVYNGYGGFSSVDLCFDISEWGLHQPREQRGAVAQPSPAMTASQELQAKQARASAAIAHKAPHQPFFGLTMVSCERGDIRQSPKGLFVYTAEGMREIDVPLQRSPRDRVLDEFEDAIRRRAAPLHDGAWGLANLELCLAAMASSDSAREVRLHEQVGIAANRGYP